MRALLIIFQKLHSNSVFLSRKPSLLLENMQSMHLVTWSKQMPYSSLRHHTRLSTSRCRLLACQTLLSISQPRLAWNITYRKSTLMIMACFSLSILILHLTRKRLRFLQPESQYLLILATIWVRIFLLQEAEQRWLSFVQRKYIQSALRVMTWLVVQQRPCRRMESS